MANQQPSIPQQNININDVNDLLSAVGQDDMDYGYYDYGELSADNIQLDTNDVQLETDLSATSSQNDLFSALEIGQDNMQHNLFDYDAPLTDIEDDTLLNTDDAPLEEVIDLPITSTPTLENPPLEQTQQTVMPVETNPSVQPTDDTPAKNDTTIPLTVTGSHMDINDIHYEEVQFDLLNGKLQQKSASDFIDMAANYQQQLTNNKQKDFWKGQFVNANQYYRQITNGSISKYGEIRDHHPTENVPGMGRGDSQVFREVVNTTAQISHKLQQDKLLAHYDEIAQHLTALQSATPAEQQKAKALIGQMQQGKIDPNTIQPADKPVYDWAQSYMGVLDETHKTQYAVYGQVRSAGIKPDDFNGQLAFTMTDKQGLEFNTEQINELKRLANQSDDFKRYYNEANEATPDDVQTYNKKKLRGEKKNPNGEPLAQTYDKTWGASNFLEFKQFELKRLQYEQSGLAFKETFKFKDSVTYVPDEDKGKQTITAPNKMVLNYEDYKDKAAAVAFEEMESAKASLALNTIALKKALGFHQGLSDDNKALFSRVLAEVGDEENNRVKPYSKDKLNELDPENLEIVQYATDIAYSIKAVNEANTVIYGYKKAPPLKFDIQKVQALASQASPFNIKNPSTSAQNVLSPEAGTPNPQDRQPTDNQNTQSTPSNPQQQPSQGNNNFSPNMPPNGNPQANGYGNPQAPQAPHPIQNQQGVAHALVGFAGGVGYVVGAGTVSLLKNFWHGLNSPVQYWINQDDSLANDSDGNIPQANPIEPPSINPIMMTPAPIPASVPTITPLLLTHTPANQSNQPLALEFKTMDDDVIIMPYVTELPALISKDDKFLSNSVEVSSLDNPGQTEPLTIDYIFRKEKALGLIEENADISKNPINRLADIHNSIVSNALKLSSPDIQGEDREIIIGDMAVKFEQFDSLLNDDKQGLIGKIKKQASDPNDEVKSLSIAQAGIANQITDNLKKVIDYSEQNALFDFKHLKLGKDKDKSPDDLLNDTKNKMGEFAADVAAFFNKVTQTISQIAKPTARQSNDVSLTM